MISMSTIHSIRQMRKNGVSIAEIARIAGVSRTTVYAKLADPDLSPGFPIKKTSERMLDDYRPVIEGWLDEDAKTWRKQRHTARRIWHRLRDEYGVKCCESTVRHYVAELKKQRRAVAEGFLDLVWNPGEAQADFGEADFYVYGVKKRLSYFVLSFPFSNMGFAQVFPSENSECVCQALKQAFEYVGGVPLRIVFDNATGVGRRVCETIRTTETFTAFAAHYGFDFSFCNPSSGHEKGNVERKVDFIRHNLFVPVCRIYSVENFNERLLGMCTDLAKEHYMKGEDEGQLFMEDRLAMGGLPDKAFNVVRYATAKASKQGKVQVDGRHFYSTDPSLAGSTLVVGLGATKVSIYTEDGELVCEHERAYGSAPSDSANPASQLPLLSFKVGAWKNSQVRDALPGDVAAYMDKLGKPDLRAVLRTMDSQVGLYGWDGTVDAMSLALSSTGRLDESTVAMAAASANSASIVYDEPIDLGVYDAAMRKAV